MINLSRKKKAKLACKRANKTVRVLVTTVFVNYRDMKPHRHAQEVIKELGILYKDCFGDSMCERFIFLNCSNIPETLPPYVTTIIKWETITKGN